MNAASAASAPAEANNTREALYVNLRDDVYVDHELNNREFDDPAYIEVLAGQIEETGGLLQGIGIYTTPPERMTEHGKKYELGTGFQRTKALNLLAEQHGDDRWITSVLATLKHGATAAERHVDQLIENLGRKDLTPMETALAFLKALNDKAAGMTTTSLAKSINWPVPSVSNYVKVARDLCPEVIALVLAHDKNPKTGLSFSHAKEIVAIDPKLDATQQKILAEAGTTLTYGEFVNKINETYKQAKVSTDEAPKAEGTETPSTTSQQKAATSIRSNVLNEKYIPKLIKDLPTLTGEAKIRQEARIDALKFVLNQPGTELGASLAPWEAELQAQADAEKAQKEQDAAKAKYKRTLISLVETAIRDGAAAEANRTGAAVSFEEAMAKAKATVEASLAAAKEKGLENNMVLEGFPVESAAKFMEELGVAYTDHIKQKNDRAAAAKAAKEKKAAEEKAAAEAAAKGEAPVAPAAEAPAVQA
jgi:hypothetical protein